MRFQADLIIALCALLISSLACFASVWQTHIIGEQLSAAVWPYLNFTTSSTTSRSAKGNPQDEVSVSVANDGLGPAIIESQVLTVGGKRVAGPDDAIVAMAGAPLLKIAGATSSSTLVPGSVIRPGASVTLLDVRGAGVSAAIRRHIKDADVSICYCSILRTCWLVSVRSAPREVGACPRG
jgi:hypothetical protein